MLRLPAAADFQSRKMALDDGWIVHPNDLDDPCFLL